MRALFLVLLFFCGSAIAANQGNVWFSIEGGGATPITSSATTTIPMSGSSLPDDYVSTSTTSYLAGVGSGYQFLFPRFTTHNVSWLSADRIGLLFDDYLTTKINGQVLKYQLFPAANYNYNISSQVVWVDNQLDFVRWHDAASFFDTGIGGAFDTTSNYQQTSLNTTRNVLPNPAFANNSEINFAYRFGIGLNYNWQHFTVAALYDYVNLGTAKTGNSTASSNPTALPGLSFPLQFNEWLISLRYNL